LQNIKKQKGNMVIKNRLANLISSSDAAEAVGISISTFKRFVEAGCLVVEYEQNGLEFFAREQVSALFGRPLLNEKIIVSTEPEPESEQTVEPVNPNYTRAFDLEYDGIQPNNYQQSPEKPVFPTTQEPGFFNYHDDNHNHSFESFRNENYSTTATNNTATNNTATNNTATNNTATNNTATNNTATNNTDRRLAESTQAESLLKVISLQDSLLTAREEQIGELQSQIRWLRARVEKLEGLIEQSQLLLLADTYSIRKLLTPPQLKQSYIQKFLAAFGIKTSQSTLEFNPKLSIESNRPMSGYSLESKAEKDDRVDNRKDHRKDNRHGRTSGVVLHLDKQQSA
jgi:hypothetical protein